MANNINHVPSNLYVKSLNKQCCMLAGGLKRLSRKLIVFSFQIVDRCMISFDNATCKKYSKYYSWSYEIQQLQLFNYFMMD